MLYYSQLFFNPLLIPPMGKTILFLLVELYPNAEYFPPWGELKGGPQIAGYQDYLLDPVKIII